MYQGLLTDAVGAFQSGDLEACVARCGKALADFPGDEKLLVLQAMSLQALGRHADAASIFRSLCDSQPDAPQNWSNLGLMLRYCGRFGEAEQAFRRAHSLAPRSYDTLINFGLLLLDMGKLGEARHRFLDALEVDPASPEAGIYAAAACFECGDIRRAEELIPPPATWGGLDGDLRHDLAMALIQVGRIEEAESILDPGEAGEPTTIARLAMLHERTNRIDSARRLLGRIAHLVEHGDRDTRIDALTVETALAMRDRDFVRARKAANGLLTLGLAPPAQANALFTLATIADKEGDPAEAMRLLAQAHALHFRLAEEIVPEVAGGGDEPLRIATRLMRPEQCGFLAGNDGPPSSQSPVFIVGFPRSGTTMLEQMLDAHPRYISMDERPILQRCIEQMEALGLRYPDELDRLDPAALAAIRGVYWSEVSKAVSLGEGQQLVDKNPLNLLRLPMIRRLFPAARIILALRHPCDVILSCYMQNFRSPAFMVLCSSLERLASSYANAMRSWIHHADLLKPEVLLLRYEETVADFAGQVDHIASFLGLDDQHYLSEFSAHARSKAYISTPSYSQVIEPVNNRSVARWEAYRPWFEPVFPILQPIADHWGYALASSHA